MGWKVLLIQDLLSGFIHPLTNDNKCLKRDPADFCQDSEYFIIFYCRDYLSHKMEIYAIRILGCWQQAFKKMGRGFSDIQLRLMRALISIISIILFFTSVSAAQELKEVEAIKLNTKFLIRFDSYQFFKILISNYFNYSI